jgi:hypothetical protein
MQTGKLLSKIRPHQGQMSFGPFVLSWQIGEKYLVAVGII